MLTVTIMISFSCPCSQTYTVGDDKAGKKATCKRCGNVVTVPTPDDTEWEVVTDEPESPRGAPRPAHETVPGVTAGGSPNHRAPTDPPARPRESSPSSSGCSSAGSLSSG